MVATVLLPCLLLVPTHARRRRYHEAVVSLRRGGLTASGQRRGGRYSAGRGAGQGLETRWPHPRCEGHHPAGQA